MPKPKYNIVILGAGNVAWHLGHQFKKAGHTIVQVYNRTIDHANQLADELESEPINRLDGVSKNADIYIIAASDHGIDDIILGLRMEGKIVAHTSGSVPLLGMEHISTQCGIFYPLQTLTKGNPVSFKDVPVFIEAANSKVSQELTALAESIGAKVYYLDSAKRKAVHVAAVFANNFTNYLVGISKQILEREKLPFDILQPLMQETLNKLNNQDPRAIQTGPAKRADYKTIEEHLHYLSKNDSYREVYLVLTEGIMSQTRAADSVDFEPAAELGPEDEDADHFHLEDDEDDFGFDPFKEED